MGELVQFPILGPGQVLTIIVEDQKVKVSIVKYLGKFIYKIKALDGKYKGYYGEYRITEFNGKKLK
jgi:hypothetical protein